MVEFALVAPVFFLLLFAIIEAGRFMFFYETLNNAAREGARYAIVNGANALLFCPTGPPAPDSRACDTDGSDVQDRVKDSAIGLARDGITFPAIAGCPSAPLNPCWYPDNGYGNDVRVRARYEYSLLVPLVPLPRIAVEVESTLVINN